ncbi:hypothetical protein [Castellaniella denitrificans]|uniref:hypothetical protein n=1 Tax=Castellaniella denitrificans TaxID=56119 RepID=UPI00361DC462
MNHDDISYALAKQLGSAYAIESNYGAIELDDELRQAIDAAVRPILQARLAAAGKQPDFAEWFEKQQGVSLLDAYVGKRITPALTREIMTHVESYWSSLRAQADPCSLPVPAVFDVLNERTRQVEAEGWTSEHDDEHVGGEMAVAAACYAMHGTNRSGRLYAIKTLWPWDQSWWKPAGHRRNLIKAAALILAEIDRLDRAVARQGGPL